ncbi:MAG: DUF3127 domain-containing protein [Candidatus Aenigmarchaeota archaeon]|nr:DUF3127 domain-containing protein [Candidatus Aenigmarchaeota archaeon]
MELKTTGTIKLIGEVQEFDSGFRKLEFVLTTKEQYPQDVKFEITQDKINNFTQYNKVGDEVEVSFNLRGNEYNGKYYTNLQAWKVFKANQQNDSLQDQPKTEEVEEDLPF